MTMAYTAMLPTAWSDPCMRCLPRYSNFRFQLQSLPPPMSALACATVEARGMSGDVGVKRVRYQPLLLWMAMIIVKPREGAVPLAETSPCVPQVIRSAGQGT